jgi:hypothetical protein
MGEPAAGGAEGSFDIDTAMISQDTVCEPLDMERESSISLPGYGPVMNGS